MHGSNGVSLRKSSFAKVQIIAKVHLTVARVFLSLLVSLLENNVIAKIFESWSLFYAADGPSDCWTKFKI